MSDFMYYWVSFKKGKFFHSNIVHGDLKSIKEHYKGKEKLSIIAAMPSDIVETERKRKPIIHC